MNRNGSNHSIDRSPALRRTAFIILLTLTWIVVVGAALRQNNAGTAQDPLAGLDLTGADQLPPSIEIAAGTTRAGLAARLEELGIEAAPVTLELMDSPRNLDLPPELDGVLEIDGYLAPGTFDLTPTTDARSLLQRMAVAFVTQIDPGMTEDMERRGVTLQQVVEIAAASQRVAVARSELPVVAAVLWNQDRPQARPVAVVGADALAAAVRPISTDATEFHRPADGDLRLGPANGSGDAPATVDPVLEELAGWAVGGSDARTGLSIHHLGTGSTTDVQGDRFIETASIYKLAVMAVVMDEVQRGRLALAGELGELFEAELVPEAIRALTLDEALRLMIGVSDNATGETLLGVLGPDRISDRLRSWGVSDFFVGSRPQVATANGVARLLELIVEPPEFSLDSRLRMMDYMRATDQRSRLARSVADEVPHKIGDLATVVNDAGLIPVSGGSWVIAVSLAEDVAIRAAADDATASLGALVQNYYDSYLPALASIALGATDPCAFAPTGDGPLSGARIALDPGHGGVDPGASADLPGGRRLLEATVTLMEAEGIRDSLVRAGAEVLLTRCDDSYLSPVARAAMANTWDADLLVSLHIDGSESSDVDSTSVLYLSEMSTPLAEAILGTDEQPGLWSRLNSDLPLANGGIIRRSIGPLPFATMPTVLTEPVVITNPAEAAALADKNTAGSDRLAAIVDAHVEGIVRYWSETQ